MTDKRLLLALPALALLVACGGDAPADDSRAASGEVLEGTISDAMLPVDRVRSEPPLEDPEAFVKAQSATDGAGSASTPEGDEGEASGVETSATESAEPAVDPAAPEAE